MKTSELAGIKFTSNMPGAKSTRCIEHSPPAGKPRAKRGSVKAERAARQRKREYEMFSVSFLCTLFPIRTVNSLNERGHWSKKSKRSAYERGLLSKSLGYREKPPLPALVTLTRIGPRRMDDEGAIASLKAVRDGIADAYHCEDGPDSLLRFAYDPQEIGPYGVRVEIRPAPRRFSLRPFRDGGED